MRRLALLLLLAACAKPPVAVIDAVPLRNPTTPVASQVDASADRLAGEWVVVQSSRAAAGARAVFAPQGLVLDGQSLHLQPQGMGRFDGPSGKLWVHWLDADNRTVALGDPGGGWFAILDRTGQPGERLRAAREILEWYGYDLARVRGPQA